MSSASNHKKRSRRGYKLTRSSMAPSNSPLISRGKREQRKAFREYMKKLKERFTPTVTRPRKGDA